MNKTRSRKSEADEMLPEYDFTGRTGERGKYYRAYRQGHLVRENQLDGTVTVKHFTLEDGAVMLEPDVRAYFPDADHVNRALRSLIALIPNKTTRRKAAKRSR